MPKQHVVVWEFRIRGETKADFERIYGPGGDWAQLFRQSSDYVRTELICDLDRPNRYLTIDYWTSREALHHFKQAHYAEYSALDKQCEALTEKELFCGDFEIVLNK